MRIQTVILGFGGCILFRYPPHHALINSSKSASSQFLHDSNPLVWDFQQHELSNVRLTGSKENSAKQMLVKFVVINPGIVVMLKSEMASWFIQGNKSYIALICNEGH